MDKDRQFRKNLIALVWAAALAWTIYLVAAEVDRRSGGFAVVVQVMGSLGILYALYLVMRPYTDGDPDPTGDLNETHSTDETSHQSRSAAQWAIISLIIALAIGAIGYQWSQGSSLHQSAVFFIGLPAVLAIILSLTPKAKSATGMIVKGISLALLLSGIVFAEGAICILMAAPLFYLVGIVIGYPIDRVRRRKQSEGKVYSIVGVGLLLLSVEGAVPGISYSEKQVVEVSRTIEASSADVRQALSSTPRFDEELPFYLKLGFPRPVNALGEGLDVGDRRVIMFGNESPMEPIGASGHHSAAVASHSDGGGVLVLEIVKGRNGMVVFRPVEDTTAFTHWISWGRSKITWEAIDSNTTQVTWTLHFRRRLSPSWYFGPWQRYAAEKAVGYLISTVATP
jgi:hypothetical protein